MGVDHVVDFSHEADGFGEVDDDLVVMGNVLVGEDTSGLAFLRAAVLGPFFADLIAADVEIPDVFGDRMEAAGAWLEFGFAAFAVDPEVPPSSGVQPTLPTRRLLPMNEVRGVSRIGDSICWLSNGP